jgi:hypothetical protein
VAWYIQILLRNKEEIRSRLDLESDEYNDLLVIEKKIEGLHNAGIISDKEMQLIEYIEDGKSLSNSKKKFGRNRISIARDFRHLCDKIAFYVGGQFTDEGYAEYMRTKYNLTEEQIDTLLDYMKSKYKNKLLKKAKKTNDK